MKNNLKNIFFGVTLSLMTLFSVGITATTISNNFSAFKNVQDTSEIVIEDVEVQENKNSIDISWTISKPDDIAVKSIVIEHPDFNDNDSNPYETTLNDGNETTIMIDGLIPNTTYSNWSIYATDNLGNTSIPYKIDDFTTYSYERPIINFSVEDESVGTDSAILDWDITSNDYDKIVTQSFQIINSNDNSVVEEHSLNTEFLSGNTNLTSLEPYTKYTYKLVFSFSPWANASIEEIIKEVNFTTNPLKPTVENLEETNITDSSATLKWEVTENPEVIDSFEIIDTLNSISESVNKEETQFVFDDLVQNTNYNFKLKVNYNETDFDFYDFPSFLTLKTPNVTTNITNITDSSVTLNWDVIENPEVIDSFEIIDTSNSISESIDKEATQFVFDDLVQNTNYNFKLKVNYNETDFDFYDFPSFSTLKTPNVTTNVTNITDSSVTLNWDVIENPEVIDSFEIIDTSNSISEIVNKEETQFVFDDLVQNTNYNFKLKVNYNETDFDFYDFPSFSTLKTPNVTTNITNITDSSVTLNWDVIENPEVIDSFEIIDTSNSSSESFSKEERQKVFENLTPNMIYNFKLIVNYNETDFDFYDFPSFKTTEQPTLENLNVTNIETNSVTLNWIFENPSNLDKIKATLTYNDVSIDISNDLTNGTKTLDNLESNTKYKFQIILESNGEIKYYDSQEITTLKDGLAIGYIILIIVVSLILIFIILFAIISFLNKNKINEIDKT